MPGLATMRREWSVGLSEGLRTEALRVARDVAARFRDDDRVTEAVKRTAEQTAYPRSAHWCEHALGQGGGGLALMFGAMDASFPGEGWDADAHRRLERAANAAAARADLGPGLYSGLSGLGFVTWYLSRGRHRYQRFGAAIKEALLPAAQDESMRLSVSPAGTAVSAFDVISGHAGVAAFLLTRRDDPDLRGVLEIVLDGLIRMAADQSVPPGWHTPEGRMGDPSLAARFPGGCLNCGLAHGIPGIIAALSLSVRSGVAPAGAVHAIRHAADRLVALQTPDQWGSNWPTAVPASPEDASPRVLMPARATWCYGSPGVARTLWLAGLATGDDDYCDTALQAMEAVYRRPLPVRGTDSPIFCHGIAGLLQITLRFAHDTGKSIFWAAAEQLTAQVLESYEPASLLGFRNLEGNAIAVDQPGLLDGAPGVVLALLAASTEVKPLWDRMFLLA
jgi:hypothetical protein